MFTHPSTAWGLPDNWGHQATSSVVFFVLMVTETLFELS